MFSCFFMSRLEAATRSPPAGEGPEHQSNTKRSPLAAFQGNRELMHRDRSAEVPDSWSGEYLLKMRNPGFPEWQREPAGRQKLPVGDRGFNFDFSS